MPNVMLTSFCNLKCPYCFAEETIQSSKDKEISFDNFKILIKIFKEWNIQRFQLIGGEPTLHSRFLDIVELLLEEKFIVHIFTNGIIAKEITKALSEKPNITYLVNHNHPSFYPSSILANIDYFLEKLAGQVELGFNIYKPEFDGDFLLEKIKRFKLTKGLRIGFANPICSLTGPAINQYIALEDYREIIPTILEFSKKCEKEGVRLIFDCVIPLCFFSKEEYGELVYNNAMIPNAFCPPVIDIGVDLRVFRCFGTSGMFNDKKITDFKGFKEMIDYFNRKFERFQVIGGMDKCFHCDYLKKGRCQGGCIGHTVNKFC